MEPTQTTDPLQLAAEIALEHLDGSNRKTDAEIIAILRQALGIH